MIQSIQFLTFSHLLFLYYTERLFDQQLSIVKKLNCSPFQTLKYMEIYK